MRLWAGDCAEVRRGAANSADERRQDTVLSRGDSTVVSSERRTHGQVLPDNHPDSLGTGQYASSRNVLLACNPHVFHINLLLN